MLIDAFLDISLILFEAEGEPFAASVECFCPIHRLWCVGVIRYASPATLMKHCNQLATQLDVTGCEFGTFCGCVGMVYELCVCV